MDVAIPPSSDKVFQKRVQNGKVYRQIFDAEVKLVKSLEKTRNDLLGLSQQARAFSVPVQRQAVAEPGCGMLTERQLAWMHELQNETSVENPVLYKFFSEEVNENMKSSEVETRMKAEVLFLPDVLVPAKINSDIIERNTTSRKLRHDAAVDEMHHELAAISSALEPLIEARCQGIIQQLDDDNEEISDLFSRITSDQELSDLTCDEIQSVWMEAASHFEMRKLWIAELDEFLLNAECSRVVKMRRVFDESWKVLEKIAYIPVQNLQRVLDKECQLINQIVLNNKRMYADLKSKLLLSNVDRQHKLHVQWRRRFSLWKETHIQSAISSFTSFMESSEVKHPSEVEQLLERQRVEQEQLNERRIELIDSLRETQPTSLKAQFVKRWYQEILDLSKKIDEVNQSYFAELCLACEQVCQTCLVRVNSLKEDLIGRSVCTDAEADDIVNSRCLPVVSEQQSIFEKKLEALDKATEHQAGESLKHVKQLFKFCQSAGNLVDTHEVCLASLEKALQDKLDSIRLQSDSINQDKETALQTILGRLRQEASEAALRDTLAKALQMLANIRLGYDELHSQQMVAIGSYPKTIQTELKNFADDVCSFFGVKRTEFVNGSESSKNQQTSPRSGAVSPSLQSFITALGADTIELSSGTKYKAIGAQSKNSSTVPSTSSLQTANKQTSATSVVVASSATLLTPSNAAAPSANSNDDVTVDAIAVREELVIDVCRALRLNFLYHLESWPDECARKTAVSMEIKTTEIKSQLELRNHLHEPRARRVELDIHNVRSAELVMHSERASRHINAMEQALVELKQALQSMIDKQQQRVERFRTDVEKCETQIFLAKKSARLVEIKGELAKLQLEAVGEIKSSIEQFNRHLRESVENLKNSTLQFLQSFKLFADGGNFCQAEITDYSKRIEKSSQKIDVMEQQLLLELKNVEPKLTDQPMKIFQAFELRFQNDLSDLQFVEKVFRWLSTCQVKIKTEVAASNSQHQNIADSLGKFQKLRDQCENPCADVEDEPHQLIDSLVPLLELVNQRATYLRCLRTTESSSSGLPPTQSMLDKVPVSIRSGNDALAAMHVEIPPISKPGGKGPAEDETVITIRQILKSQKVDTNGEAADQDSLAMLSNSNVAAAAKKPLKAHTGRDSIVPKSIQQAAGKSTGAGKNKMDGKFLIFGEVPDTDEQTYFKGRIKAIVRDTLAAILTAAEANYKLKGNRQTTKPGLMQDSFDECAESVIQNLQSYVAQTEDYHDRSINEFRAQVAQLECLAESVPRCVMGGLLKTTFKRLVSSQDQHWGEFNTLKDDLHNRKESNGRALRPGAGHPQHLAALTKLCLEEEERHAQMMQAVSDVTQTRKDAMMKGRVVFVDALAQATKQLLSMFDQMLTVSDLVAAKPVPVKYTPCELVRRKIAGQSLDAIIPAPEAAIVADPGGPRTWPELLADGVSSTSISQASLTSNKTSQTSLTSKKTSSKKPETSKVANELKSAKVTSSHHASIAARDEAYQDFKRYFDSVIEHIESESERVVIAETRWKQRWKSDVENVKLLY